MTSAAVTLTLQDEVGIIQLNRPEVHNAFDEAMMLGLEESLDRVEANPEIRVIVLTGAGDRTFCAGGDLDYFASLESAEAGRAMSRRMNRLLSRLADGPRPVIAAVNGGVYGGGCEVLVACHLRVAVATARFSFRQAAMGVVTGWGGGVRVMRQLGRRALRLLLTADKIDAVEALRLGLIDQVVEEPEKLLDEVLALAGRIAAHPPQSVTAFLELARVFEHDGEAAASRREADLFAERWVSEHFRSKVAQFRRRDF